MTEISAPATGSVRRRWCVVETEYRHETLAEKSIEGEGYTAYVPRYRTQVRERGSGKRKWINVQRPLFPSYLFAEIGEGDVPWGRLTRLQGVSQLIHQGYTVVRIPDAVIDRLRADQLENFGLPCGSTGEAAAFAAGEPVRIIGGPFTGLYGNISRIDAQDRITLFVEFLGMVSKLCGLTASQLERR